MTIASSKPTAAPSVMDVKGGKVGKQNRPILEGTEVNKKSNRKSVHEIRDKDKIKSSKTLKDTLKELKEEDSKEINTINEDNLEDLKIKIEEQQKKNRRKRTRSKKDKSKI